MPALSRHRTGALTLSATAERVVYVERRLCFVYAIELVLALTSLAFVYRLIAKRRWVGLDWLVCRNAPLARGAG